MEILVSYKRVVDPKVSIQVKLDSSGVDRRHGVAINPFDDISLEETLRLRKNGAAEEVVTVGNVPPTSLRICTTAWRCAQTALRPH